MVCIMRKNFLIIGVLVIIVLISGCTTDSSSTSGNPYIGGDNGLVFSFIQGAPPAEIFDNKVMPFRVGVNIKNDGEFDVKRNQVYVKLEGINARDFGVSTSDMILYDLGQDLNGKSLRSDGSVIPGEEVTVLFPGGNREFSYQGNVAGTLDFILKASICYLYKSSSTTTICVKENLLDSSDDDICIVNGLKQVYSSSSPIQVMNFNEYPVGKDKIGITFDIVHQGSGTVVRPGGKNSFNRNTCDYQGITDTQNLDWVYVVVDPDNSWSGLSCNSLNGRKEGYVKLYDLETGKSAAIRCEIRLSSNEGNYYRPLNIDVFYQYDESIRTSIKVKHTDV